MSKQSQQRVKEIRQKRENNTFLSIPLGTDGLLVDMLSKLDLQEELKLGNDHYVQIEEDTIIISDKEVQRTIIKEWYFKTFKGSKTIEQMKQNGDITFSVKTEIIGEDNITMTLYEGDISDNKILHTKEITIQQETSFVYINQEVDKV